jgi:hypothetical protein
MKNNKREIAVKARFIAALTCAVLAVIGLLISNDGPFNPWIELAIKMVFSVYCGLFGYILGWDANKKPSTLKGP